MAKNSTNLTWPRVGFLGCGNMGGALLKGMIGSGNWKPENLKVLETDPQKAEVWKADWQVSIVLDIHSLLDEVDAVVLAVKPQIFPEESIQQGFHNFLKTQDTKPPVLISLMAGLSSAKLTAMVGEAFPVVRTMPNLPLSVGVGVTAIEQGHHSEDVLQGVETIFQSAGGTVRVKESQMDAVTGLSGSGPMYVFEFINGLIEAGKSNGLAEEASRSLAIQTAKGALKLLESSEETPSQWTEKVCSKGGTTLAGLGVLEERGFQQTLHEAVSAATKRSVELGR
jgi:pyrroline-5-carboxylate reductase